MNWDSPKGPLKRALALAPGAEATPMTFRARVQASGCLHPVSSELARPMSVCTCRSVRSRAGACRVAALFASEVLAALPPGSRSLLQGPG